jgi:hypothetical protein
VTEAELYREAYNAHEGVEEAALTAMGAKLGEMSLDALACLADPSWGWERRSSLSPWIMELASDALDAKLEAQFAAELVPV